VAINLDDAPIADNADAQPTDTPVIPGAAAAYFSSLPLKALRSELLASGIAAELSHSAGSFVCNHVFFGLMHALATQPALRHTRGGFVHVPWLPAQGVPSMTLDETVRALGVIVEGALRVHQYQALVGGATH
jgi:pyroglutamyl-peptidase